MELKKFLAIYRKKDGDLGCMIVSLDCQQTFNYYRDFFKCFDAELLRTISLTKFLRQGGEIDGE